MYEKYVAAMIGGKNRNAVVGLLKARQARNSGQAKIVTAKRRSGAAEVV
jgi:hypothetical protein